MGNTEQNGPMTTARARQAALEAEARLEWDEAARLWHYAAEHYPEGHPASQDRNADISRLRARARQAALEAAWMECGCSKGWEICEGKLWARALLAGRPDPVPGPLRPR